MCKFICCLFKPQFFGLAIALFSVIALSSALSAQYLFGLEPCILCIYQRIPYVLTFIFGLQAFRLGWKNHPRGARFMVLLAGISFLINSMIASYHVGVEQHWWVSMLEGCTFDPIRLREAAYQPAARCDNIPWQLFGISMAGYNALICAAAGLFSILISARATRAD